MKPLRHRRGALPILVLLASSQAVADVPATEVMTVYRFNGPLEIPYYGVEAFRRNGTAVPAGALTQGTSVVPCLVIRDGRPLTDRSGTPFVGFEVIVDSRRATRESTEQFKSVTAARRSMTVTNHHCAEEAAYVLDTRNLFALDKPPKFEPPVTDAPAVEQASPAVTSESDQIVRAFHNSPQCADANGELVGRRAALQQGWSRFSAGNAARWSSEALGRARQLDFAMRTAIFEGHLDRGCNAYGSCERNIIALSIRNRARESCRSGQGCGFVGDVEGVASNVSQYNIWDEYLTQVSGLTSCFLRRDLVASDGKLGAIYAHTVADVERILFGDDRDLEAIFPRSSLGDLKALRHYYHPPAMGKCFPDYPQVEFMAGAVAGKRRELRAAGQHPDRGRGESGGRIPVQGRRCAGRRRSRLAAGTRSLSRIRRRRPQGDPARRDGLPALWDSSQLQIRFSGALSPDARLAQHGRCAGDSLQRPGSRRAVPEAGDRPGGGERRRGLRYRDETGSRSSLNTD